ncbi:hypothetical protein [Mycobacterium sp. NPDC050441]|uniref:hypothetical protein n=1 Tax=Mycobacterium sp. NPDC050441 TaxID=3155403 RepID=UPI0033FCC1D1
MTGPDGAPNQWSYSAAPSAANPRKLSRRTIIAGSVGLAVVVLLVVALVAWLAWPRSAPVEQADSPHDRKPLLSDKPPTMILNAIDFNSLYPPGYTDYDSSKSVRQSDGTYDPDREYTETSSPPGCTWKDDPIETGKYDFTFNEKKDPERYEHARISRLMFPVDDPGGNKAQDGDDRTSFVLTVFPAKDPNSLDYARQWYERCQNAKTTTTVTKFGQVVETTTGTVDNMVTNAPESAADDSFAVTTSKKDVCDYYGLVRGMIVNVACPPIQKEAGAQLFRKVIIGLQEI